KSPRALSGGFLAPPVRRDPAQPTRASLIRVRRIGGRSDGPRLGTPRPGHGSPCADSPTEQHRAHGTDRGGPARNGIDQESGKCPVRVTFFRRGSGDAAIRLVFAKYFSAPRPPRDRRSHGAAKARCSSKSLQIGRAHV